MQAVLERHCLQGKHDLLTGRPVLLKGAGLDRIAATRMFVTYVMIANACTFAIPLQKMYVSVAYVLLIRGISVGHKKLTHHRQAYRHVTA